MNWLLVTTAQRSPDKLGTNPGDEFARLGIELLIREVDPDATFELLDKENTADWNKEHTFDRAVICGMPMFWSNAAQTCSDIWWWDYLWNSYVTGCKRNTLCLGVGHVLVNELADFTKYGAALAQVDKRSWEVVVREPVCHAPAHWVQSICPSAYCMRVRPHAHTRRLCNLMSGGGHFGYLTPEGELWEKRVRAISDVLRDADFTFVAHTWQERDHATTLGWPPERVRLFNSAAEYLDLYAKAECYFGNRLHAAAVCAATSASVWAVTHDSRLGMVRRLGGHATTAEGVDAAQVKAWIESQKSPSKPALEFAINLQYEKMLDLLRRFAGT